MSQPLDLTGLRFGMLTVLLRMPRTDRHVRWFCICECERVSFPSTQDLRGGRSRACGCMNGKSLIPFEDRFWAKVEKSSGMFRLVDGELSECWLWTGSRNEHDYGKVYYPPKKAPIKATRVSWLLETGSLPELNMLHKCDNPPCVRPAHLFEGTMADNSADMAAKGRSHQSRKQFCPQGHPYNSENTLRMASNGTKPNGEKKGPARKCRACEDARTESRRDLRQMAAILLRLVEGQSVLA